MGVAVQYWTLLKKNFLVQRRQKLATILEIVLPAIFALVMLFIRQQVAVQTDSSRTYIPFQPNLIPFNPNLIAFTPNSNLYSELAETAASLLQACNMMTNCTTRVPVQFVGFETEEAMVAKLTDEIGTNSQNSQYLGGVIFESFPLLDGSQKLRYRIRLGATARNQFFVNYGSTVSEYKPFENDVGWHTGETYPSFQKVGPREGSDSFGGSPGYFYEGFLAIQYAIDAAAITMLSNRPVDLFKEEIGVVLQRLSYPAYVADQFVVVIQGNLPFLLMIGNIMAVLTITRNIVLEKEKKLKEFMKIMGLSNSLHWAAHITWNFGFLIISAALITLFLCVQFGDNRVLSKSDPSVIFVFLLLYSVATVTYSCAISSFFVKGNTAAAVGGLIWFFTYMPYFFIQPNYADMSYAEKMSCGLIINVAISFGAQVIGMYEGTGEGLQWSNVGRPASVDDTFAMSDVFIMLIVDSILCLLIAVYIEGVHPGDDGLPLPWYFPFQPSYWCDSRKVRPNHTGKTSEPNDRAEYFEREPQNIRAIIEFLGLTKQFGNYTAVDNLRLNMFEGQITALLGHNGAGKSTTIAMLTGLIPPSCGTAVIDGCNVATSMSTIRQTLGLCPQYNVLFDNLTVEEHFYFYGKLRNIKELPNAVETMLEALKMVNKRHSLSKTLSGGMKRKLSVGIALIGDSKVIILDEPTAGMDPSARRSTWDLLQKLRAGRTMILTTHYMEEADLLGDRIAIMAHGKVQCFGSSLFLKSKYGAGYHLSIVFHPGYQAKLPFTTRLIESFVPECKLDTNAGLEATYKLPQESVHKFESMFVALEAQQTELGIASFGASVTTMEEVFLRVGEQTAKPAGFHGSLRKKDQKRSRKVTTQSQSSLSQVSTISVSSDTLNGSVTEMNAKKEMIAALASYKRYTGVQLFLQQFRAMLVKKILHTCRNWKILVPQLLIPVVIMSVMLAVNLVLPSGIGTEPPLELNMLPFHSGAVKPLITVQKSSVSDLPDVDQIYQAYMKSALADNNEIIDISNDTLMDPPLAILNLLQYNLQSASDNLPKFNQRNILAAYFQSGNVIIDYLNRLSTLNATGQMNSTQFEQIVGQMSLVDDMSYQQRNLSVVGLFNNQPYHSPAITLNAIMTSLMHVYTGQNYAIETVNAPLPSSSKDKIAEYRNKQVISFDIAASFVLSTAFLSATFVIFLIRERVTKAKHLQFVSGVHPANYWVSTFLWDFINILIPFILVLIIFAVYGEGAYVDDSRYWLTLFIFMLYAGAVLPYSYLASFLYSSPTIGFVKLTILNVISGTGFLVVIGILEIPQLNLLDVRDVLFYIFMFISPHFCVGQALRDMHDNFLSNQICEPLANSPGFCESSYGANNPCCPGCDGPLCLSFTDIYQQFDHPGCGRQLLFLMIHIVIDSLILYLLDMNYIRRLKYFFRSLYKDCRSDPNSMRIRRKTTESSVENGLDEEIDRDVLEEQLKVEQTEANGKAKPLVLIKHLRKNYGRFTAVKDVNLSIEKGEFFGLLGINGAGKTTTFKMLTGDETLSSGEAFVDGFNVRSQLKKAQQRLGYCPQFDALIDLMTGYETLQMFARLRGIPDRIIPALSQQLLEDLALTPHAKKLVSQYSGGNKRKLSIAVALLGNPPVVLLDEPTNGIDPVARRLVWNLLTRVRQSGASLILTSHSMEECDALCTRLAIMVGGQFKCLGSPQYLKAQFGSGYTVVVKVAELDLVDNCVNGIRKLFPDSHVKEIHQRLIHLHVGSANTPWSHVFGGIESLRATLQIVDYSVSQTTLEQIFLNFSRGNKVERNSMANPDNQQRINMRF